MTEDRNRLFTDLKTMALGVFILLVLVMLAFRLPMVVTGSFVDKSGVAVTDVTVSSRSDMLHFGPTWRSRREVQSRFFAWCLTCGSIHLLFSKDSYLSETLTLYSSHDAHGTPELEESSHLFGMVRSVTVTMESIANAAPLVPAAGRVVVDAKRLPFVLALRGGAQAVPANSIASQTALLPGQSASYLVVDADRDNDDHIVLKKRRHPNWRTEGTTAPEFDYPRRIVIRFHGSETGGILFDPPDDLPRLFPSEQVLRRMREAPARGYLEVVDLPLAATHSNNAWYFYFRSGDRYGKGEIKMPEVNRERSQLSANVRLWINEAGGRELRANYYR